MLVVAKSGKKLRRRQLLRALEALGETPGAIARRLEGAGLTGFREDPESCVVAQHLRESGWPSVLVDYDRVTTAGCSVATPEAVSHFLGGFDLGHYPKLDAEQAMGVAG